jgi:hypothetical protein
VPPLTLIEDRENISSLSPTNFLDAGDSVFWVPASTILEVKRRQFHECHPRIFSRTGRIFLECFLDIDEGEGDSFLIANF